MASTTAVLGACAAGAALSVASPQSQRASAAAVCQSSFWGGKANLARVSRASVSTRSEA